jgi:signal transduction histidine kinase
LRLEETKILLTAVRLDVFSVLDGKSKTARDTADRIGAPHGLDGRGNIALAGDDDDGDLGLFLDRISKYIDETWLPKAITDTISIRHLITHTSGLPRESAFPYWTDHKFPTREELIGKPVVNFYHHPADREKLLNSLRRRGEITDFEVRLRTKDNRIVYASVNAHYLVDEAGMPAGIEGSLRDITQRRELEEQLLHSQKMEAIGRLGGGIAHDFNNLLQGVFGYISMAKLTHDQKEKSLSMLEQAEKALHQSVSLTSQLLTFSKGGQPVKKVVALRPLVEDACSFALSGSRTVFRIEADDGLWNVEADEGQVGQVVQNLVLNADQAMPVGGQVMITARNVPVPGPDVPQGLDPRHSQRQGSISTGPDRYPLVSLGGSGGEERIDDNHLGAFLPGVPEAVADGGGQRQPACAADRRDQGQRQVHDRRGLQQGHWLVPHLPCPPRLQHHARGGGQRGGQAGHEGGDRYRPLQVRGAPARPPPTSPPPSSPASSGPR